MTTRYFGAPVARNEDRRLLTGRAQFVASAKVRSKQNDRLFAIGVAALPARPRVGIRAIHIGDDDLGPVDAFDCLC